MNMMCSWWSVEAEFRSLTVCWMKLLCCVVGREWMLLCHFSDGSRVNRPRLGWVLALRRHPHASWWCFQSDGFLLLTRTRTRAIFFFFKMLSVLTHNFMDNTFGLSVSPHHCHLWRFPLNLVCHHQVRFLISDKYHLMLSDYKEL